MPRPGHADVVEALGLRVKRGAVSHVPEDRAHHLRLLGHDLEPGVPVGPVPVGNAPHVLAGVEGPVQAGSSPLRYVLAVVLREGCEHLEDEPVGGLEVSIGSQADRSDTPALASLSWASTMTSSLRPSLSSL